MGNSCSCSQFCQSELGVEPEREEYPITTGKKKTFYYFL